MKNKQKKRISLGDSFFKVKLLDYLRRAAEPLAPALGDSGS